MVMVVAVGREIKGGGGVGGVTAESAAAAAGAAAIVVPAASSLAGFAPNPPPSRQLHTPTRVCLYCLCAVECCCCCCDVCNYTIENETRNRLMSWCEPPPLPFTVR